MDDDQPTTDHDLTVRPIHVTAKPDRPRIITTLQPPIDDYDNDVEENENSFDVRLQTTSSKKSAVPKDLRRVMSKVFPAELLSNAARKIYLPPSSSNQIETQLPDELKAGLDGIFPHALLAMSRKVSELSLSTDSTNQQTNVKGQSGVKTTKTPFYVRVADDDDDRHIFSD